MFVDGREIEPTSSAGSFAVFLVTDSRDESQRLFREKLSNNSSDSELILLTCDNCVSHPAAFLIGSSLTCAMPRTDVVLLLSVLTPHLVLEFPLQ
jgi:hypothetical protein